MDANPWRGDLVDAMKNVNYNSGLCKTKGRGNEIVMFKIKSEAWYAELREHCAGDDKLYEVLK